MEKSIFRPILFSTPMVQAILEGRKTMTRRIVKKKYSNTDLVWHEMHSGKTKILVELQNDTPAPRNNGNGTTTHTLKAYKEVECPYEVGNVFWVRETFCEPNLFDGHEKDFYYKADNIDRSSIEGRHIGNIKWKPSIFMPKEACRIFLKIKSIRVERLQDISEEDAKAEGIIIPKIGENILWELGKDNSAFSFMDKSWKNGMREYHSSKEVFFCHWAELWCKINGRASWDLNPFVFVYEFEQIEKPLDFIV